MIGLLADTLLVLSVLFVRRAAGADWPLRLVGHTALLALLLAAAASGPAPVAALVTLAWSLLQAWLCWRLLRPDPGSAPSPTPRLALPLAIGIVLLSLWLLPDRALPTAPRGLPAAALAILLLGLLSSALSPAGGVRLACLLLAGNGMLPLAATLPGQGIWPVASLLLLQAALMGGLLLQWRRPLKATSDV